MQKDMSEELDIPLPTVSKVLKLLVQGNLLESQQGSQGISSIQTG